ncbi:hypothetical protein [Oceanospirillum sanctuarii]|uniref:hypothetical protein n=1 Tax=Oceanospirillum sanctuarii TaxID=1434821 RepID=UPI000A3700BA|nr:hypothetical protein [Oceanospirillum sanctuarii]
MSIWEAIGSFVFFAFILTVLFCSPAHIIWLAWKALKNSKHPNYIYIGLGISLVIAIILIYLWNNGFSTDSHKLAEFGSYFGGVLTPFGILLAALSMHWDKQKELSQIEEKRQIEVLKSIKLNLDSIYTDIRVLQFKASFLPLNQPIDSKTDLSTIATTASMAITIATNRSYKLTSPNQKITERDNDTQHFVGITFSKICKSSIRAFELFEKLQPTKNSDLENEKTEALKKIELAVAIAKLITVSYEDAFNLQGRNVTTWFGNSSSCKSKISEILDFFEVKERDKKELALYFARNKDLTFFSDDIVLLDHQYHMLKPKKDIRFNINI